MAGSVKLLTPSGGSVTINAVDTASALSVTLPATSDTITTNASAQTLANKTLTNPVINGFTGDTSVVNIGSGQIYKDASGNVGIGTNSPVSLLHVNSAGSSVISTLQSTTYAIFRSKNSSRSIDYGSDSTGGYIDIAGAPFRWYNVATELMRLDSSGRLGIGTTSPGYALEVHKQILIKGNNSSGADYQDWPDCSFNIRRSDDFTSNGITMASFGYRNDPTYFTDSSVCNIRIWDTTQAASAATSASTTKMTLGSPGSFSILTGNAADRLAIDSTGRVTKPYQPAFSVYSNDGANITGANLKINVYSGVDLNVGSCFNTTNSRFTAPVAGVYLFKAMAWLPPNTTIAGLSIRVNGTQRAVHRMSHTGTQSNYCTLTPTLIYYLNANDYVELYTSTDGGTIHPSSGNSYSNFSGYLLG